MTRFSLQRGSTGLLLIDVQEKLCPQVERSCEVLQKMIQAVKGFRILGLPVAATEQYPQGLGETVSPLKEALGADQRYFSKTTFSCLGDEKAAEEILSMPVESWVLAGIEAHVCILQTARQLLEAGKNVVVLNDAISSRSIYDYSTAIAEIRDDGARISTTETVLFELVGDSKIPEFREISQLVKCTSERKQSSCCL